MRQEAHGIDAGALAAEPSSRPKSHWHRFFRSPLNALCLSIIIGCLVCAVAAPVMAPYGYQTQDIGARLQGPTMAHLFGTDDLGRDMLSRIIWGARVSITVSFASVGIGCSIATLIGMCAGFYRGVVDAVVQRFVDFIMAMPALIILLVIVSIAGRGLPTIIAGIAVIQLAFGIRISRATTMQVSALQFIEAARATGASNMRILFRHVLPSLVIPMSVVVSVGMGVAILAESALSFLGYGVVPPTPSWGSMLSGSARVYMINNPWMSVWPGLAIASVVFAFNMLGDSLRDVLDPRLRN